MSTNTGDYCAISYWPSKDDRVVFVVKRAPGSDAMTEEELIERDEHWGRSQRHLRVVEGE